MFKRTLVLLCCFLWIASAVMAQDVPDEIDDFDDDWDIVIEQLDDSGYINEDDGEIVFEERRMNFDDEDDDDISIFLDDVENTDFVMAATLQFEIPDDLDFGVCMFTFRDHLDGFLGAGVDNFENIFLLDQIYDSDDDVVVDIDDHGEDYDEEIHIIIIALDEEVTVYANGELFFEEDDLSVRSGGISLFRTEETDCEAEDIWVWEIDSSGSSNDDDDDDRNTASSGGLPDEIEDFDGASEDVIAQLVDEGVLGSGNAFLFGEDFAFIGASGSTFTSLGRNRNRTDVVMAGELTFDSQSSDYERCGLLLRVDDSRDPVEDFLWVGLDSDGDLAIQNNTSSGRDDSFDFVEMGFDLDEPQHLIMIARGDRLDVYVNGELTIVDYEISEVRGIFGVAQFSDSTSSSCEARNIWVYDTPFFEEGVCNVVASGTINKRSGPGTNFDLDGQMNSGETLEVDAQTEGEDGFIWYELEDGSYVREDIISLVGDCSDIDED